LWFAGMGTGLLREDRVRPLDPDLMLPQHSFANLMLGL
jgi:hypothetical protein